MLHHLRCPSCFHDLDLPRESEQPGRLLTCPTCGWEARMWQWVSESRKPGKWTTPFLIARLKVHELALLMDFTGNLDAPLP